VKALTAFVFGNQYLELNLGSFGGLQTYLWYGDPNNDSASKTLWAESSNRRGPELWLQVICLLILSTRNPLWFNANDITSCHGEYGKGFHLEGRVLTANIKDSDNILVFREPMNSFV